ncbi:hypothetical protein BROSI_A3196 [Candidatus Brocadia sinica JPN1]|uniref:Uncharacterized protein n=1 Tax=Candidatus Brocadia sinica JPN1 TaxID=1197129 RepID=A0ABQ0K147_9BACT|nr:hypothetical protein BROSI_A3196 [Candidatus Brocadia sinica JPN1]GIK11678.1 MAG: hypothetical protein BroJett002_03850 [Candidatus Brocadia sinica]GJQ19210.1 MAG: hypothetical protein HBSIN01_31690 [Candidatus Brocadia sinica]
MAKIRPVESIAKIERELVKKTFKIYNLSIFQSDTLFLMNALGIKDFHKNRLKFQGVSVYN